MGKSGHCSDMLTIAWLLFSAWKVGAGRQCHSILNNLGKVTAVTFVRLKKFLADNK